MKKTTLGFIALLVMISALLIVFIGLIAYKRQELREERYYRNYVCLYEVQFEAYINIKEDSEFVNTATDEHHMVVPEKYYTDRESAVAGDGALCVYLTAEGDVIACFGDLEHDYAYYDLGFKPYYGPPNIT